MNNENIKENVKKAYGKIASTNSSCGCQSFSCCGSNASVEISQKIGYSTDEMESVPKEANLGLGCGNPTALANIKKGDVILDLGSGAGFDCFLAANKTGKSGKVIGVDMTPQMIAKARANATNSGYDNVEFRLGEIENLPVKEDEIDIIISNCVINLSPEKEKVFKEAYRVLKDNGKMMISDIVLLKEIPSYIKDIPEAYSACISGAIMKNDYIKYIENAGFKEINIISESQFTIDMFVNDPIAESVRNNTNIPADELADWVNTGIVSLKIEAKK